MDSPKHTPTKQEVIMYFIVIGFIILLMFFVWVINKTIEIFNSKP
jgi:preprotein translocase subunit SecE